MKQAELATLMGRQGNGGHALISRIELGHVPDVSLRVIADYLRACRANFSSIADILDQYAARPTVPETQGTRAVHKMAETLPPKTRGKVLRYDTKTRHGREKPEPKEKRLDRVRRMAASWLRRQRVEDCVHFELNRMGVPPGSAERFWLADFGRRVFKALTDTRGKDRTVREKLLTEIQHTETSKALSEPSRQQILKAVSTLFQSMEQTGALDWLPPIEETEHLAHRTRGRRVKNDAQLCLEDHRQKQMRFESARNKAIAEIQRAYVQESGLSEHEAKRILGTIVALVTIGLAAGPGTEERRRRTDECVEYYAAKGTGPNRLRELARFVFDRLDPLLPDFPPDRSRQP